MDPADPWAPGTGSQDPWQQASSAPTTVVEVITAEPAPVTGGGPYTAFACRLSREYQEYMASRLNLAQLFAQSGSGEVPPSADEAGAPKPTAEEFSIDTPSVASSTSPGWHGADHSAGHQAHLPLSIVLANATWRPQTQPHLLTWSATWARQRVLFSHFVRCFMKVEAFHTTICFCRKSNHMLMRRIPS